jgi:hypothetical protein
LETWTELFGFVPQSQLKQLVPHFGDEITVISYLLGWRVKFSFSSEKQTQESKAQTLSTHWGSTIRLMCPILLAQMRRNHIWLAVYNIIKKWEWANNFEQSGTGSASG